MSINRRKYLPFSSRGTKRSDKTQSGSAVDEVNELDETKLMSAAAEGGRGQVLRSFVLAFGDAM